MYDGLCNEALVEVLKHQRGATGDIKAMGGCPTDVPRAVVILDECDGDEVRRNSALQQMVCNGRSYGIHVIIVTRSLRQLGPVVRANMDFVFLLHGQDPRPCPGVLQELWRCVSDRGGVCNCSRPADTGARGHGPFHDQPQHEGTGLRVPLQSRAADHAPAHTMTAPHFCPDSTEYRPLNRS